MCLLRGINVGGKTIKMEQLKELFRSLGFSEITTILASGNVIFASNETDIKLLTKEIEAGLNETFGFEVSVVIRTVKYVQELVESNPFKSVTMTPGLRLFVSFIGEKTKSSFVIPYESPQKDYRIVSATSNELFIVIEANGKTTDAMEYLDKKFNKNVTTRNWNTIQKIILV